MGELTEQRWAVISERGCEASGMIYVEAAALMRRLASEKVYGLCVVTSDVARFLPAVEVVAQPTEARRRKS
jgi:hypothetical protein